MINLSHTFQSTVCPLSYVIGGLLTEIGARFGTMRFGIVAWGFRFSEIEF